MTHTKVAIDNTVQETSPDERAGFGALETERGRLPLVAMDVKAVISDLTAETTLRQTFRNSLDEALEATYILPLPDRAAVTKFQLRVADRTIDGILKERAEAREEYDRAIQQGHRAAIAEENRSGVFSLRVGNIPPREMATVEFTMVGPLPVSDGEATFRFPLVVAPRYTPGIPLDGPSVGPGTTPDTDEVPDASCITPPVLLPGFPNPVRLSLQVQLQPTAAMKACDFRDRLHSSLHSTITDEGPPWTVRLQPDERLNRDFLLRFPVAGDSLGTSLRFSQAADGKPGIVSVTLLPPSMPATEMPRDVVFVLDRSGSMSGWKMVAARRAIGRMIDTLLDQDRFTVLAFDDSIERPPHSSSTLMPADNRQRWQILEWLGGIESRGGTEMGPALEEAMRLLAVGKSKTSVGRRRMVVVVTDGQVTGEDAILRSLATLSGGDMPRIFTVGIDRAVNAGFLHRLATCGLGHCELVESEDRLDEAMHGIHRLIGTPVLTQVRVEPLDFDLVADSLAPAKLPDLFVDRPVTLLGRHLSHSRSIRLRVHGVDANGRPWSEEVAGQPCPAGMLSSMWGRARVRDLEDLYASGAREDLKKLAEQIVKVSLESHVLSRFTAYVAVDRSEVVNQGGKQTEIVQPVEMPEGWEMATQAAAGAMYRVAPSAGGMLRRSSKFFASLGLQSPPSCDEDKANPEELCCRFAPPAPESVDSYMHEFTDTAIDFTEAESTQPLTDIDGPIKTLVHVILSDAIEQGALEIRVEPLLDRIRVTYLVADQLVERDSVPIQLLSALVEQIKKLANLDLTICDQPQQGQLPPPTGFGSVLLAVQIVPTSFGESVAITITPDPAAATTAPLPATKKRKKFWT